MTPAEIDALHLERCRETAARAELDDGYQLRCLMGEKVFYVEYHKSLMPGHIYSSLGADEFRISRLCEFHFDEMAADDEEWDDE